MKNKLGTSLLIILALAAGAHAGKNDRFAFSEVQREFHQTNHITVSTICDKQTGKQYLYVTSVSNQSPAARTAAITPLESICKP